MIKLIFWTKFNFNFNFKFNIKSYHVLLFWHFMDGFLEIFMERNFADESLAMIIYFLFFLN